MCARLSGVHQSRRVGRSDEVAGLPGVARDQTQRRALWDYARGLRQRPQTRRSLGGGVWDIILVLVAQGS